MGGALRELLSDKDFKETADDQEWWAEQYPLQPDMISFEKQQHLFFNAVEKVTFEGGNMQHVFHSSTFHKHILITLMTTCIRLNKIRSQSTTDDCET